MKASAGSVLMFVENRYPRDTRVRNEACTLSRNGFDVTVIALRGRGEPGCEVVDGVRVYRIPRLTVFGKLPPTSTSRLARIFSRARALVGYVTEYAYFTTACLTVGLYVLVRHGVDVVHAHNPPDTLSLVALVFKVLGKKSVFDHHDLSAELYLSRYRASGSPLVTALRFFEWLSVKLADVVIATNESYKRLDVSRHRISPEKVFIVRNGPDLGRVRLVEPDGALAGRANHILGYVGAINPQDGVDYLLRSLRHLLVTLGRADFYCVIVGDGDSRSELEAEAVALGLANHVHFTGFVDDDVMLRALSAAEIGLDPNPSSPLNDVSTWIKVMEYMALGKPVVSFDLHETRVSAGGAALYVPPNDELAYARAVARLMDDAALRASMSAIGLERIHRDLSWEVTSRNLLEAYRYLSLQGAAVAAPATGD